MMCKGIKDVLIIIILLSIVSCNRLSKEESERFKEAILKDDRAYIQYILSKGLDLNDEDMFGYIPLHIAVGANNRELIDIFLQHGADINCVDGLKCNCLFKTYDIETVKYLIERGANVNQVNKYGEIPLFNVTWYYDLAKLYIESGSDIHQKDELGFSILFSIIMNNNYKLLKYLIEKKSIDINDTSKDGFNSLIWFFINRRFINRKFVNEINEKDKSILKLLIKNKININHQDKYQNTALHYAVRYEYEKEFIRILLDNSAKVEIKNIQGETPLDIAVEKGRKDIIDLLKRYAK